MDDWRLVTDTGVLVLGAEISTRGIGEERGILIRCRCLERLLPSQA